MNQPSPSTWLTPTRKGYIGVLSGAAFISFAGLFVKEAPIDPSMVAFYRLVFGGAALLLVALLRRERILPSGRLACFIAGAAVFFGGDLLNWHACIVRLGPGLATIMANFQVFFIAISGVLLYGEKLSSGHKLAIPLSILGLMMLLEINPALLPPRILSGVAFGVLTALFYTAYILTLRKAQSSADRLPAIASMAVISLLAGGMVCIYCLAGHISFAIPDLRTGVMLAALGIFCQAFGWVLLATGLPHLPASRAGLIMLIQPTLAFIWDILIYDRPTGAVGFTGAAITLGAIGMGIGIKKK